MTTPKRILVVDDSALALDLARAALEQAGFIVMCANGLADLDRHIDARPDLVLLDVQMPEAFGDDVGMVLRAVRGVDVPIILYSSLDERELERRAAEADIDGYVCKRNGLDAMIARVRATLAAGA